MTIDDDDDDDDDDDYDDGGRMRPKKRKSRWGKVNDGTGDDAREADARRMGTAANRSRI